MNSENDPFIHNDDNSRYYIDIGTGERVYYDDGCWLQWTSRIFLIIILMAGFLIGMVG